MTATPTQRMFPIQFERGAKAHPRQVPWWIAELAYSVYAGRYGHSQSLERLAERGGFAPGEMDEFLPDWRERCDENAALRERLEAAEKDAYKRGFIDGIRAYAHHKDGVQYVGTTGRTLKDAVANVETTWNFASAARSVP